jgi:hypothetical protein
VEIDLECAKALAKRERGAQLGKRTCSPRIKVDGLQHHNLCEYFSSRQNSPLSIEDISGAYLRAHTTQVRDLLWALLTQVFRFTSYQSSSNAAACRGFIIVCAKTTMVEQDAWARLATLRRQYFQLVDPSQLRWLEGRVLKDPEVQSWIFSHMFDMDTNSTLPPDRYRFRVLKVLVSKLEKAIEDPEEDVRVSFHLFYSQGHLRIWIAVRQRRSSQSIRALQCRVLITTLPTLLTFAPSSTNRQSRMISWARSLPFSDPTSCPSPNLPSRKPM